MTLLVQEENLYFSWITLPVARMSPVSYTHLDVYKRQVDENAYTEYDVKFAEAMGNDINTSSAITVLYDMLKEDFSPATKRKLAARFDEVLSLGLTEAMEKKEEAVDEELAAYVEKMIQERKAAKKEKNFARADEIRDELAAKGIVLKDTREGTLWQVEK